MKMIATFRKNITFKKSVQIFYKISMNKFKKILNWLFKSHILRLTVVSSKKITETFFANTFCKPMIKVSLSFAFTNTQI